MKHIRLAAYLFAFALIPAAHAQPQFETRPTGAQFRDVAIHAESFTAFAAAYDRNQLWRIDLRSGETIGQVDVGRGPASVAIDAAGENVAVVNRLDGSATIVRISDGAIVATLPCGDGASSIAALPAGGFAVAATFADQVTLIDPRQPDRTFAIENVASVPHLIAATRDYLAVATRAPNAILLYVPGARTPARTINFESTINDITASQRGEFIIATENNILRLDPSTGNMSAPIDVQAMAIDASSGDLVALTEDSIVVMARDLSETLTRIPLTSAGIDVATGPGIVAVVAPADRSWQLAIDSARTPDVQVARDYDTEPVDEPEPTPMPEPVAEPAPPAPEPKPAPIEREAKSAEPEPEADPEPAPEQMQEPDPEPVEEPAPKRQPERMAEAPKASEATTEPSAEAAAEPRRSSPSTIREAPLSLDRPRAPRAKRPAPTPLGDAEEPSLSEGLVGMRPFGATDDGFVMPDFSQEGTYEADESEFDANTGTVTGHGNVFFTIDQTDFRMDHFTYSAEAGNLHGWGNVVVTQGASKLEADDIYFESVPESERTGEVIPEEMPLNDPTVDASDRRALGSIRATGIDLEEPSRKLTADALDYDFRTGTGSAVNVQGQIGVFYFGADEIVVAGADSIDATNVWITTCDCEHDYYRLRFKRARLDERTVFIGKSLQLELLGQSTPLIFPSWRLRDRREGGLPSFSIDYDSGRDAEIGYFLNVGQRFAVSHEADIGYRIYPTEKKGVGFGVEGSYDYMSTPTSWLYRSEGSFRSMYTTKDSGHFEWYHRHEIRPDTTVLAQWEQWFDKDFVKEFYYERYRNRSEPRTFANVTHTKPRYIATATASAVTHGKSAGTEKLPEATFHLLERPLLDNLYFTFDAAGGYYQREPGEEESARLANVARLTYDWNIGRALNITPFAEFEGVWYSETRDDDGADFRVAGTFGATAQTRLTRTYGSLWNFSAIKHILVPSLTYSYRPKPTMDLEDTLRFDAYDNAFGRSRIEAKIDNIFYGRDAQTDEVWQVARVSFYAGHDFWNELPASEDYEIEIDIRPRPEWGFVLAGETHNTDTSLDLDDPFLIQRSVLRLYERIFDRPADPDVRYRYNARFGDYDRVLGFIYYNDPDPNVRWNGRIGYTYAKTQNRVFSNELLYGLGYRINDKWSVAFEHRYDFDRNDLTRQSYELRRIFADCIDGVVEVRERSSGWDVSLAFSLTAFPGTRIKF